MSSERCYTRIKRGMVFWYNIDVNVNKFNVPDIKVSDKKSYKDYLEYGDRPWLLVSVDEKNVQNKTCTIVPLCTNDVPERDEDEFHVNVKFRGKDAIIMCEHLRTVNCVELIKYDCTLENGVMKRVEDALKSYLGIRDENPIETFVSENVALRLEEVINSIVKKKVEEERKKYISKIDVEDAVLRISEGLETLFDVSKEETKERSIPKKEKEDIKESVVNETKDKIGYIDSADIIEIGKSEKGRERDIVKRASRGQRKKKLIKWDKSTAISFIQEVQVVGEDVVAEKYGYADYKSVHKTVKYLESKYNIG